MGTEALFPEDKLPLPGGPAGTVLPPAPGPCSWLTSPARLGSAGRAHPPRHTAAQLPRPLLSCLLMTPGRQVPSQSLLVAVEPSKESSLPPLAWCLYPSHFTQENRFPGCSEMR